MKRKEFELALSRVDASDFNASTKTLAIVAQYTFELEQHIVELEAPKTCDVCDYFEGDEKYAVCNCTEFQTCTTPTTVCFIGYKPKETK